MPQQQHNNNNNIDNTTVAEQFFIEWDAVERMHPYGIVALTPFFSGHGISSDVCNEVDELIFVDLMIQRQEHVRHIKVEGRGSGSGFWVIVELRYPIMAIVSYHLNPAAPLQRSMIVAASPGLIVSCIVALYRWAIGSKGRCGCHYSGMMMTTMTPSINNNNKRRRMQQ